MTEKPSSMALAVETPQCKIYQQQTTVRYIEVDGAFYPVARVVAIFRDPFSIENLNRLWKKLSGEKSDLPKNDEIKVTLLVYKRRPATNGSTYEVQKELMLTPENAAALYLELYEDAIMVEWRSSSHSTPVVT